MSTPNSPHQSPSWNRNTKLLVTVVGLIILTLGAFEFTYLIRYLVIAGIIAYLLNPIIQFVADRTPLKRGHSILLSYLIFLALIVWGTISIGVAGVGQIQSLIKSVPTLLDNALDMLTQFSERSFTIFNYTLDLSTINWEEIGLDIAAEAESAVGTLIQRSTSVVGGAAQFAITGVSSLANFAIIIVMSIYISQDVPRLGEMIVDWADLPGYRDDAARLWREFGRIWRAYLRGQVILAFTMWGVVWVVLTLAGVQNSFALGFVSGIFEFLPIIGPLIAGGIAVIAALFQSDNWMGLSTIQYGLLITAIMILLQQVENSVLVPRIVGKALDLTPLWTILVVFMGSSIAGILGAILAAPVAATIKLLGSYAWRKLFDQPPFPKEEKDDSAETQSTITTSIAWLKTQSQKLQSPSGKKKTVTRTPKDKETKEK